MLAAHPLFRFLAKEVCENCGDCCVQLCRNALSRLDGAIERARKRRIFDQRHTCPAGLFPDLRSQQIAAFRQHLGRFHRAHVEGERHGIVRRIGDHHACFFHIGTQHAPAHLPLQGADAPLHLRIAFRLLELLAHLLLAHLQTALPLPPFDDVVHQRPRQHDPGCVHQQLDSASAKTCGRRARLNTGIAVSAARK